MKHRSALVRAFTLLSLAGATSGLHAAPITVSLENGDQFVEHNGTVYRVEKALVDGVGVRTFTKGAQPFTFEQLREKVATETPRVVTHAAAALASNARADEALSLAVLLRPQPAGPIAREERGRIEQDIRTMSEGVLAITSRFLPQERLDLEAERNFQIPRMPDEAIAERRVISAAIDSLLDSADPDGERIHLANLPFQQTLETFVVEQLGGEVYARTTRHEHDVRASRSALDRLAAHELVANIDIDHPGEPELDNMAVSLGLTTGFWANGITGGIHDVGILDTGVQQSHPNLAPHNFLSNMGANDTGSHGTGMAGIIASTHPTWRGMSYGIDTIVVARAGAISTSMPGMNYIASTGVPETVNYSFGNGTASSSDYNTTDQFFDGTINTFGFMVSKSAGNGGFGSGNPTITHPAPAYNLMATANMDDFNNTNRATHRITSTSSRGPTVLGRKKPDITAPGNNSFSTTPSGGFANIGGTSSAAPKVSSGIVLLWDAGVTNVMAGKAILLNTADAMNDMGTSSTADDVYVDGSSGTALRLGIHEPRTRYLNLNNSFLGTVTGRNGSQPYRFFSGPMQPFDKATLVWERHVAYNGATFPTQIESLSDLDLWAYRQSSNAGVAASTSAIDNVEQIHSTLSVNEPSMVLKVSAFGNFDPDAPSILRARNPSGSRRHRPRLDRLGVQRDRPRPAVTLVVSVTNTGDLRAQRRRHAQLAAGIHRAQRPDPRQRRQHGPGRERLLRVAGRDAPDAEFLFPHAFDDTELLRRDHHLLAPLHRHRRRMPRRRRRRRAGQLRRPQHRPHQLRRVRHAGRPSRRSQRRRRGQLRRPEPRPRQLRQHLPLNRDQQPG